MISSNPSVRLSAEASKLVSDELRKITKAFDSKSSLKDFGDQIRKNQDNFQRISESWSIAQLKLRQPDIDISGLSSIAKSIESLSSATAMSTVMKQLENKKIEIKEFTANIALEKLVLASAYNSRSFAESVVDILNSSRPSGWKNTGMSLTFASNIGKDECITSVHVLTPHILNRLVSSKSKSARRNVLYENRVGIINKCLFLNNLNVNDLGHYLEQAVHCFKRKDYAASQSLSANIIETLIQRYSFSDSINKSEKKSIKFLKESEIRTDLTIEKFVLLNVLSRAYAYWKPNSNLPIPKNFNRNITVHYVNKSQYNVINSLEAIMLCSGLLFSEKL